MHPHIDNLNGAVQWLQSRGMTPASFLVDLLESDEHAVHARDLFQTHSNYLLQGLSIYAGREMLAAAQSLANENYAREIVSLSSIGTGLHFRASNANTVQVAAFNLNDIGAKMRQHAPGLWDLLGILLSADPKVHERRTKGGKASAKRVHKFLRSQKAMEVDSDDLTAAAAAAPIEDEEADSDAEYWQDAALLMEAPTSEGLLMQRSKALIDIVSFKLCYKLKTTHNERRKRSYASACSFRAPIIDAMLCRASSGSSCSPRAHQRPSSNSLRG